MTRLIACLLISATACLAAVPLELPIAPMSRLARLQMAFAPQGPAVRITTQGGRHAVVVNIFIGEGAVAEAAAGEFTTDCPLLTEIYWASAPAVGGNDAGGVSDPHEVTGAARQDGDACELGAPMLTP